mgnify:CR=1 FL=1
MYLIGLIPLVGSIWIFVLLVTDSKPGENKCGPIPTELDGSFDSGDITLDSVADINLDAGGADIVFKDDGTQFGKITNDGTHITIFDGAQH